MGVKSGQLLFSGGGFVIDRIQTGGVTNLNIPQEVIREVGNFNNVGIIDDIPDLTFEVQSLDVSTDIEALTLGVAPSAVTAGPGGTEIDFNNSVYLDIISPFRSAQNQFDIVNGVVIPCLTLEQVAYKFGVGQNAEETFTFRGDSIYYSPGTPYAESFVYSGSNPTHTFVNGPAILYMEKGVSRYALSVSWRVGNLCQRLFPGEDYTETSTSFTLTTLPPVGATVFTTYTSLVAGTYGPNSTTPENNAVKPAAVRAKDIDVYIAAQTATPVFTRFTGVQSVDVTRKVTLSNDEEFGNPHYVSQDYDTADVSGTLTVRPASPSDFYSKVATVQGVGSNQVVGPLEPAPVEMEIHIYDPDNHNTRLKTIYIPDAIFTAPPVSGKAGQNQKLDLAFKWMSSSGEVQVYKGAR